MTTRKTLDRQGRRTVSLATAAVRHTVLTLERPETHRICNASMPNAPQGFAWPHLAEPVRVARGSGAL